MLHKLFLDGSVSLAQLLSDKNIKLSAKHGSPLGDLFSCASLIHCYANSKTPNDFTLEELIDAVIHSTSITEEDGSNTHTILVNSIVELVKPVVEGTVSFAKNEALPTIKELYKNLLDLIEGYRSTLGEPFLISISKKSILISDNAVSEMVTAYSSVNYKDLPPQRLPLLSKEQILETVKKGFRGLSEVVEKELSDESFLRVGKAYEGSLDYKTLTDCEIAVLFLICRSTNDEPFEGTNLSLIDFNLHNSERISQIGGNIYRRLSTMNYRQSKLNLYSKTSEVKLLGNGDKQRTIFVDPYAYKHLLEKDLSAEAIFGNELLNQKYDGLDLIKHKEELEKTYSSHRVLQTMVMKNTMSSFIKKSIEKVFLNYIKNTEIEKAYDEASLYKKLYENLQRYDNVDEDLLPGIIRDITCNVFYTDIDVGFYLKIMDNVAAKYKLEPREAASVALIEYVTHWFISQIEVTKV